MIKSERIETLAAALVKVQAVLRGVKKTSENPFFHSQYADLSECWDTIRQPLTENGLAVVQSTDVVEDGAVILETVLIHECGEYIGGKLRMMPEKPTPQALGSCITYARRYGLMAMVGLTPVDDDGNDASHKIDTWDGVHWQTCPVHIGSTPGTPLGSLHDEAMQWLQDKWQPGDSKEDRQLVKALMQRGKSGKQSSQNV